MNTASSSIFLLHKNISLISILTNVILHISSDILSMEISIKEVLPLPNLK